MKQAFQFSTLLIGLSLPVAMYATTCDTNCLSVGGIAEMKVNVVDLKARISSSGYGSCMSSFSKTIKNFTTENEAQYIVANNPTHDRYTCLEINFSYEHVGENQTGLIRAEFAYPERYTEYVCSSTGANRSCTTEKKVRQVNKWKIKTLSKSPDNIIVTSTENQQGMHITINN